MDNASKQHTNRIMNVPLNDSDSEALDILKRRIEELEKRNKELSDEKPITIYFNKSMKRLTTLNKIGMKIATIHSFDEIARYVVHMVAEEINANRVSLMLLNRETNELEIKAAVGIDPGIAKSSRVKLGRQISGWVAQNAQPVLVRNIHRDERFKPATHREMKYATDSFISTPMILNVPIKFKGSVVGVMNANDKRNGEPFHEDDLTFLSTVAAQAAIAYENSRLFDQLKVFEIEQESLQQQLFQAQKLEALGELLTGITHELNNRLAPVLVYAQFLQLMHEDSKSQKYLKTIEESVTESKTIIESMVTFAKPRLPNWEMTDVNNVIQNALDIVRFKLSKQNIKTFTDLNADLPRIMADPEQLKLVLVNIFTNAHFAMEKSGGKLFIRTTQIDGALKIEVEDTGIGISKEILPKIFDPFFTTKEVGQGTGLGLSVCYGIVRAHHGQIDVQSDVGKGSTVTVWLPLENTRGYRYGRISSTVSADSEDKKRKHILVVDDDKLILETISEILKVDDMWNVVLAENGLEAVQRLEETQFDIIVSDLRMPGMDGFRMYDWILENKPEYLPRIVFTTGDIHDPKTRDFLEKQQVSYLAKPFNIKEFKKLLTETLHAVKE